MKLVELKIEILQDDKLFALFDKKNIDLNNPNDVAHKRRGAFAININEAEHYNEAGFGIFVTVNKFKDYIRRINQLEKIRAWSIDIDHKDWKNLRKLIEKTLMPSLVVKTKAGYQIWWFAKDATVETYHDIVSDRLVETFSADKHAKDIARLLRAPGYFHVKDPSEPYMIEEIYFNPRQYTEEQMLEYFPVPENKKKKVESNRALREVFGYYNSTWAKISELDCVYALRKLSGKPEVLGEEFSFYNNKNGTQQIFVNGKSTSSWVDQNGLIGSHSKGGPTIFQWVNWYLDDKKKTKETILKYFKEELEEKEEQVVQNV